MPEMQYNLCPKCGAVSSNGVCTTCGYKVPDFAMRPGVENELPKETSNVYNPPVYAKPQSNDTHNGMLAVAVLVLIAEFVLCGVIFLTCIFVSTENITNAVSVLKEELAGQSVYNSQSYDPYRDDYTDFDYEYYSGDDYSYDDYSYGNYIKDDATYEKKIYGDYPSYDSLYDFVTDRKDLLEMDETNPAEESNYEGPEDYYDLCDYIDTSLSYRLEWAGSYYDNYDSSYNDSQNVYPEFLYADFVYPRIVNSKLSNEDAVNKAIYDVAMECIELYDELNSYVALDNESIYIGCEAFVTYMDEDVLSILFDVDAALAYDYATDNEELYRFCSKLYAININMKSGTVIKGNETFEFGGDFYKTFKAQCKEQNGVEVRLSDEELIAMFENDEEVWFYTPLGLEVGCNDTDLNGWSTGTFKDVDKLRKVY